MAVQTVDVGTLTSRVFHALGNTSTVPTGMATEIKFHLGYVLNLFVRQSKYAGFRKAATFDTVADTTTYSLADDVMEMDWPSVRNTTGYSQPLLLLESQLYNSTSMPIYLSGTGRPGFYVVRGRDTTTGAIQLQLYPTPDAVYTISYEYLAVPTAIIGSTADNTELDRRFPRDLVSGLVFAAASFFPQYLSPSQQAEYTGLAQKHLGILMQDSEYSGQSVGQGGKFSLQGGTGNRGQIPWPTTIYTCLLYTSDAADE